MIDLKNLDCPNCGKKIYNVNSKTKFNFTSTSKYYCLTDNCDFRLDFIKTSPSENIQNYILDLSIDNKKYSLDSYKSRKTNHTLLTNMTDAIIIYNINQYIDLNLEDLKKPIISLLKLSAFK